MKYGDLIRSKPGMVHIYETTFEDRLVLMNVIQGYATKAEGKFKFTSLNAFDHSGNPFYLLRVEVEVQGRERSRSGPAEGAPRRTKASRHTFKYKGKLMTVQEIADASGKAYNTVYQKLVNRLNVPIGEDVTDLVEPGKMGRPKS